MNNFLLERTQFTGAFNRSAKKVAECIIEKKPYRIYVENFLNSLLEYKNLEVFSEALSHPDAPKTSPIAPETTPDVKIETEPKQVTNKPYDVGAFIQNEKQKLKNILNSAMIKMNAVLEKDIGSRRHSKSVNYMALIKKIGQTYYNQISQILEKPESKSAFEKSMPRITGKTSVFHDPIKLMPISDWEKILISKKLQEHPNLVNSFKQLLSFYEASGRIPNQVVHNWLKKNKINLDMLVKDAEKTKGGPLLECILLSAKNNINPVLIVDKIEKNVLENGLSFDEACENTIKDFKIYLKEASDDDLDDLDDGEWVHPEDDIKAEPNPTYDIKPRTNPTNIYFGSDKKVFQNNLEKIIGQFDTAIQNSNLMTNIKNLTSQISTSLRTKLADNMYNNSKYVEKMFKRERGNSNAIVLFNQIASRYGFEEEDFNPLNIETTIKKFDRIYNTEFTQEQKNYLNKVVKSFNLKIEKDPDPDEDLKDDDTELKISGWSKFRNYISKNKGLVAAVGLAAIVLGGAYGLSSHGKTELTKNAIEEIQSINDETSPSSATEPNATGLDPKLKQDGKNASVKNDDAKLKSEKEAAAKKAAMEKLKTPIPPWPGIKGSAETPKANNEPNISDRLEKSVDAFEKSLKSLTAGRGEVAPKLPVEELLKQNTQFGQKGYLGQPNLIAYKVDGEAWVKSTSGDKLGKMLYPDNLKDKVNRAKNIGVEFNPAKYSFEVPDQNGNINFVHAADFNIRKYEAEFEKAKPKPEKKVYGDPFEYKPQRNYQVGEKTPTAISGDSHGDPVQFLADNPGQGAKLVNNNFDNVDQVTAFALANSPNSLSYNDFVKLSKNGNNSTLTNALIKTQMDILKSGHTVTPYNLQQAEKQHKGNYQSNDVASSSSAVAPQQSTQPEVKQDSTPQQPQNDTSTSDNKEDMSATVQKKLDSGEDVTSIINGLGDNVDAKTAKTIIKSGKINSQQDAVRLSGKINPYQTDAEIASEINKLAGYKHVLPNMDIIKNSIKNGMSPYDIISIYSKFTNKSVLNDRDEAKYPIEYHWANTNDLWTGFEHLSKTEKVYGWAKRLAGKLIMNQYGGIDNLSNLQDNVYTNVVSGLALNKVISQQEAQVLMKNANKILDDNVKTQLEKIANGEVKSFKEHRSFRSFLESKI